MKNGFSPLAAASVALLLAGPVAAADPVADIILHHGHFYTPSGWQEAVALRQGRIVAVGSDQKIGVLHGPATKDVDLQGQTVLPGLGDMHVHPLMAGQTLTQCSFTEGASPKEIIEALAGCVKTHKPGEWIQGGHWEASSFHDKPPTKEMLDQVSPDNPVVLTDISMHSAWLNSKALSAAKIDRNTPNPEGGIIEHDTAGNVTGLLRESAAGILDTVIPPPTLTQNVTDLKTALDILLSHGITLLTDADVRPDSLLAYDALADQGKLKQRVRACLEYGYSGSGTDFDHMLADRATFARPNFETDCVKVFMDGVPTESHTAAMLEPYATSEQTTTQTPARGMLLLQPSELDPAVTKFDKMGLTVKFHAAGDWAVRTAMDAVAAARKANGPGGATHDPGHLTFMSKPDLARAKQLRTTLEYSPYLWFPSPINDDIIKAIGPARIKRVWAVREGIESGALVVAGSDWPVVPSANPWIGIETLVTRKAPDNQRPGESYGPAEAITLKQAIDLFTINAARQLGKGALLGSIEKGKIADLIVLDRDPFAIPITDIHNVKVSRVFIEGEQVR